MSKKSNKWIDDFREALKTFEIAENNIFKLVKKSDNEYGITTYDGRQIECRKSTDKNGVLILSCEEQLDGIRSKKIEWIKEKRKTTSIEVSFIGYEAFSSIHLKVVNEVNGHKSMQIKLEQPLNNHCRSLVYDYSPKNGTETLLIDETYENDEAHVYISNDASQYQFVSKNGAVYTIDEKSVLHEATSRVISQEEVKIEFAKMFQHPEFREIGTYIKQFIDKELPGLWQKIKDDFLNDIIPKPIELSWKDESYYNNFFPSSKLPILLMPTWDEDDLWFKYKLYRFFYPKGAPDFSILNRHITEILSKSGLINLASYTVWRYYFSNDVIIVELYISNKYKRPHPYDLPKIIISRNKETQNIEITVKYMENTVGSLKSMKIEHTYEFTTNRLSNGEIQILPNKQSTNNKTSNRIVEQKFCQDGSIQITLTHPAYYSDNHEYHHELQRVLVLSPKNAEIIKRYSLEQEILWHHLLQYEINDSENCHDFLMSLRAKIPNLDACGLKAIDYKKDTRKDEGKEPVDCYSPLNEELAKQFYDETPDYNELSKTISLLLMRSGFRNIKSYQIWHIGDNIYRIATTPSAYDAYPTNQMTPTISFFIDEHSKKTHVSVSYTDGESKHTYDYCIIKGNKCPAFLPPVRSIESNAIKIKQYIIPDGIYITLYNRSFTVSIEASPANNNSGIDTRVGLGQENQSGVNGLLTILDKPFIDYLQALANTDASNYTKCETVVDDIYKKMSDAMPSYILERYQFDIRISNNAMCNFQKIYSPKNQHKDPKSKKRKRRQGNKKYLN